MQETLIEKKKEGTYENPVVLSNLDEKAAKNKVRELYPHVNEDILDRQILVEVTYLSQDHKYYRSQIMVDIELEHSVRTLFNFIQEMNVEEMKKPVPSNKKMFFVDKIYLITDDKYKGDDIRSIEDNNTSGFNYRNVEGTYILSTHALGFSLDINPKENPIAMDKESVRKAKSMMRKNPNAFPPDSVEEILQKKTYTPGQNLKKFYKKIDTETSAQKVLELLRNLGFEWGGDWKTHKDFHHFQKIIPTKEYIEYYLKNTINIPDVTKEEVVKRIERLIFNNIGGRYTENLVQLISDQKIKDKIEKDEYDRLCPSISEDLVGKF